MTRSGLEGQLLGLAIQHEQPELEREKGEMLKREEDFKLQLAALEKDLLQVRVTAAVVGAAGDMCWHSCRSQAVLACVGWV